MSEGGLPEWGCMPELCPTRRPPTRARAIFVAGGRSRGMSSPASLLKRGRRGRRPGRQVPYMAARALQRDWRYSMTSGTPKHLDRFRAVNTSGSGPAASNWPFRSSMAWVNPSGTSST